MKKFYELSKPSVVIGLIAATLYIVDNLISGALDLGRGFMWVAFVAWTITFNLSTEEKVRLWIGNVIGFAAAVGMIYFGRIFDAGFWGIGIAAVVGVFLFNGLVMYLGNAKKFWVNSVTGIFMGIFLTFSGLGIGLSPDTWGNAGTLFGVMMLYSVLGGICAFLSVYFMGKWRREIQQTNNEEHGTSEAE